MSAVNLRLGAVLKDEAAAYAQALGISLNALVAVAVRDYLDARKAGQAAPDAGNGALATVPAAGVALPSKAPRGVPKAPAKQPVVAYPKVGRNDPCPCGSGRKYKVCHGGVA